MAIVPILKNSLAALRLITMISKHLSPRRNKNTLQQVFKMFFYKAY